MNSVLMVALDYPPCQSAGVQRTQKFVEYLPALNWHPLVLTAKPIIYESTSDALSVKDNDTYRAFGLNTYKHLSIKGKHFAAMMKPDRYFSWYWHGRYLGEKIIKQRKPNIIWSTFPCSTALKIAATLKRVSGLPWVADFRDPFSGVVPDKKVQNNPAAKIDRYTIENADHVIFSTQATANIYMDYYARLDSSRVSVITNGFNEDVFAEKESDVQLGKPGTKIRFIHSGALYPGGRDPRALVRAITKLQNDDILDNKKIELVFRGAGNNPEIQSITEELVRNGVSVLPSISYRDSIAEILESDVLVLLQGQVFNTQVPGKAYDYLRSGKTILALTHEEGATAALLRDHPGVYVADMQSEEEILLKLKEIVALHDFEFKRDIKQYNRKETVIKLAQILDSVAGAHRV